MRRCLGIIWVFVTEIGYSAFMPLESDVDFLTLLLRNHIFIFEVLFVVDAIPQLQRRCRSI